MSAFLDSMLARAKDDLQTIVLPEGDDERTLQAAERILAEGVANLVVLGDAAAIEASPYALDDARIVDVRTPEEYAAGHLPGAENIPLDALAGAKFSAGETLFVYCHSGARSARAAAFLKGKGIDAVNMGGIAGYRGKLE